MTFPVSLSLSVPLADDLMYSERKRCSRLSRSSAAGGDGRPRLGSGHAVKLRAQDEATATIPATGEIRRGERDERGAEDTDRGHVSASGEERGYESVGGKVTQAAAPKI